MPLSALRHIAVSDEVEDTEFPDIPVDFQEPAAPRPGDANYTHAIFYDPDRFEAFPDRLLQKIRAAFPAQPLWQAEPVHAASLHGRMAAYSSSHTDQFIRDGYVPEIEMPTFKGGKAPKRSLASQAAWDAFLVNASFAEAVADAIRTCRDEQNLALVFQNPVIDALAPIVGKFTKATAEIAPGVRFDPKVLCKRGGLLVAPRAVLQWPRAGNATVVAYPADPTTVSTVSTSGRQLYATWTTDRRIDIRRRVLKEIRAWFAHPDPDFDIEAVFLSVLQTVAILRIQATDWKARERRSYVLSEAGPVVGDAAGNRTKAEDDQSEFARLLDGLRGQRNDVCPIEIRRAPVTARADVISMLAGGIGLEDEAIWRDNEVLRDNLARQDIGGLATWIGQLKRFHQATFSVNLARLIEEIVTDTPDTLSELERTGDDWSAARVIRSQFPDEVWQALLQASLHAEGGERDIQVTYTWNTVPTERASIVAPPSGQDDTVIAIAGPLLDLSAPRRAWFRQQLEQFRATGSLTI